MASPVLRSAAALQRPGTVFLDTARRDSENTTTRYFADPERVLCAATGAEVLPALQDSQDALDAGYHVAGYVTYEAGYALHPSLHTLLPDRGGPLLWLGIYDAPQTLSPEETDALWEQVPPQPPESATFQWEEPAYREAFETVKQHIREGDVYQINLTGPVALTGASDPLALYAHMRRQQPVPYGAYLHTGTRTILSASPELFIRQSGSRLWTRPMKGTAARPPTPQADEAAMTRLRADAKTQAENLMIVDLLRNDLSVCCTPGSVRVPDLFTVERHPTVLQMTSTVEGTLQPNTTLPKLFQALFPCGSVVGAPKLRAMRIIRALEPAPRGVYCGAIGYAAPDDTAVFNVAIRTVEMDDQGARMGTGGGLVWDSNPEAEYDECVLKSRFLVDTDGPPPLVRPTLIETMRWNGTSIPLLDRHLQRLTTSAQYFGIPFDRTAIRTDIKTTCSALPPTPHIVRGTLDFKGAWHTTTCPLQDSDAPWRLTVSPVRVDPSDVRLHHKTTARTPYDEAAAFAQAHDCDEALLLSTEGVVTEGARSNVFVERNGTLYTSPCTAGLLGGVYRAHILDTRTDVAIQPLTLHDLRTADAVYCCNAVRGWVEAVYVEPEPIAASCSGFRSP